MDILLDYVFQLPAFFFFRYFSQSDILLSINYKCKSYMTSKFDWRMRSAFYTATGFLCVKARAPEAKEVWIVSVIYA